MTKPITDRVCFGPDEGRKAMRDKASGGSDVSVSRRMRCSDLTSPV